MISHTRLRTFAMPPCWIGMIWPTDTSNYRWDGSTPRCVSTKNSCLPGVPA